MATTVLKLETDTDVCTICSAGGELMTPEEYDAEARMPMQVPLRVMLLQLNNNKALPDGRLCMSCARRAVDAYEFSNSLSNNSEPPLSEKIRALRRRLHELTQKIDVFIVVGTAGADGTYSEDDIIMVEREALAAATAADDEDLERAKNSRGETVYQCSVCPESFQRVSEYRTHIASHPANSLHSCWTCGAQFSTRAAQVQHARDHADLHTLVCHLCSQSFQTQAEMRRHTEECPSRCPACGEEHASRAELSAHASAAHPRRMCALCFAVLLRDDLYSAHMLRHRQAKQFVCGYDGCILRFGTRNNLMSHIRKCHSGGEEPTLASPPTAPSTTCEQCGRTFRSVAAMKRHARVHRPTPAPVQQDDSMDFAIDGEVEYLEVETLEEEEDAS